jgi:spore coat polysaccharide biosynthesis protein SpsF
MNNNNIGIIIQARTSSTRLPNKITLEVDKDVSFLDVLLKRLSLLKERMPVTLATSILEVDNVLEHYADKYGIGFFQGSELNVLQRFINCAEENNIDTIIRICSDNPFIDIQSILELSNDYKGEDYLSFSINNQPSILTHFGFFCEIVSLQALKKLASKDDANCIEHVTNCIYKNPNDFNVRFINKSIINENIRCTFDTEEDFIVLKNLYFEKVRDSLDIGYLDLIKYIETKPDLIKSMKKTINENIK